MDVELDSGETRLSVEANLNSDLKKHIVKLKETSVVFYSQDAVPVTNASVMVNDGTTDFHYIETEPGIYESELEYAGEPGKTYSLSINNVDVNKDATMEEYLAKSTMREPHVIDSIKMHFDPDYESYKNKGGKFWLLSLYMKDDVKTEDHYAFACRVNDVLVHDTISEILVNKDTYFNGKQTKGVDVGEFSQSKPDEILKNGDKVTLETYAIDEDYYDFVSQLIKMDEGQNMFSGPPGNIKTNISNGAMGFFAVYSITRTSVILKTE